MQSDKLQIIECPRDAMQGLEYFIPTETKVGYINTLLGCGFDVLDMGSFVSPKAIPQMRDTAEVLDKIQIGNSSTELLSIIANKRGAEAAVSYEQISYLGYPFSISETFQQRNTNKSIEDSKCLITLGLGFDWTFEKNYHQLTGQPIYCYDHSVNYSAIKKRCRKLLSSYLLRLFKPK